jgi:hypothetical protein
MEVKTLLPAQQINIGKWLSLYFKNKKMLFELLIYTTKDFLPM